jgi:hypothetical protein
VFQNGSPDLRLLQIARPNAPGIGKRSLKSAHRSRRSSKESREDLNKTFVVDLDSGMQAKSLKVSLEAQPTRTFRHASLALAESRKGI